MLKLACPQGSDRAATSWGMIVAAHIEAGEGAPTLLQVAYQAGPAEAGAPVFDLDGKLVAVHCRAAHNGSSGNAAVAIAELGRTLAADGQHLNGDGAARNLRKTTAERRAVKASEFVAELSSARDLSGLLREHWRDPADDNLVEVTIPPGDAAMPPDAPVGELAGEVELLKPLRVMVHRIDLARPSPFADLRSGSEPQPVAELEDEDAPPF